MGHGGGRNPSGGSRVDLNNELEGQLPLFDDAGTPWNEVVCKECGYPCTSSKECAELAGYLNEGEGWL